MKMSTYISIMENVGTSKKITSSNYLFALVKLQN